MTLPAISFVYISNRPGSIDLLAVALGPQQNAHAPPYELVVVDGWDGRVERGEARRYLEVAGVPLGWYGPPKPRLYPFSHTGFVNAMNTGLLHCRGSHVVFLHDYTMIDPEPVRAWWDAFAAHPATLIHGTGVEYEVPAPAEPVGDVAAWPGQRVVGTPLRPWVPEEFEVGYWGGPLSYFEATNGIDERADFCAIWALDCVKAQARLHGYALKVLPSLKVHMIDHHLWDPTDRKLPETTLWYTRGWVYNYPTTPEWTAWSANDFHLAAERRRLTLGAGW